MSKKYIYEVEEYSQDVRRYRITSNVKLTDSEVRDIYRESDDVGHLTPTNLTSYMDWSNERFTDDEIINKINIFGIFKGTDYGDDCQVDVMGDFEDE
tara:strand:- start:1968 stop:2258 length:291 start_codon:yes stop_codon:yes gene_type:complete